MHELLLERPREAAAAEVPAVELLQEAGRAVLAELAHRLADEEQQLGHDLLARRLGVVAHDLAQRPRVALRGAADHHRGGAGRREHRLRPRARGDVARGDHRDVDERDELGRQRVVGRAGVHLLRRARMQGERRRAGLDEPRARRRGRCASRSRRPRRIFTETGSGTASATASTSRHAWSGSSRSEAPAPVFVTFLTGQPKFMSTMSAPAASTIRAASAIATGSEPKIWIASGCSSDGDPQVAERPLVPVLDPGDRDHLGADEAGAVAAALAAERLHAHPAMGARTSRPGSRRPRGTKIREGRCSSAPEW